MTLRLRWLEIDPSRHIPKTHIFDLPESVVNKLREMKKIPSRPSAPERRSEGIPISEMVRRCIFMEMSACEKYRFKRHGVPAGGEREGANVKWRRPPSFSYFEREKLAEKDWGKNLPAEYHVTKLPTKLLNDKRCRVSLRLTEAEVDFLKAVAHRSGMCVNEALTSLIIGKIPPAIFPGLLLSYRRPYKISFQVSKQLLIEIGSYIRKYHARYGDTITRSEIFTLAFHEFQVLSKEQRNRYVLKYGRRVPGVQQEKISVSLSYEYGKYWKQPNINRSEIRAAAHYLLRNKIFKALIDPR